VSIVRRRLVAIITTIIIVAVIAAGLLLFWPRSSEGTKTSGVGGNLPVPLEISRVIDNATRRVSFRVKGFSNGSLIPANYTCSGRKPVNPAIEIDKVPPGSKSLILVLYDPDALGGVFYHWLMYNIPPNITVIPEDIGHSPKTPYGEQGVNDYIVNVNGTRQRMIGYGPPCPPRGKPHRYIFMLIALDKALPIPGGMSIYDVLFLARNHVLGYGVYYGVYKR
jgi:Raf kinase inhibitor-like YbhB/YbcL family protein